MAIQEGVDPRILQHVVHHETGRTLVAVKEKLLQRTEVARAIAPSLSKSAD
jgi:hypothetical protein